MWTLLVGLTSLGVSTPTSYPTAAPSASPSASPPISAPTSTAPTFSPSTAPTFSPTSASPTTSSPTLSPTKSPTTLQPSKSPTFSPTTKAPTTASPTLSPTLSPTIPPPAALGERDIPYFYSIFPDDDPHAEYPGVLAEYFLYTNPPSFRGSIVPPSYLSQCSTNTVLQCPTSNYGSFMSPNFVVQDYNDQFPDHDYVRVWARREKTMSFTGVLTPLSIQEQYHPMFVQLTRAIAAKQPFMVRWSGLMRVTANSTFGICSSRFCTDYYLQLNSLGDGSYHVRVETQNAAGGSNIMDRQSQAGTQTDGRLYVGQVYRIEVQFTSLTGLTSFTSQNRMGLFASSTGALTSSILTSLLPTVSLEDSAGEVESLQAITLYNATYDFGWQDFGYNISTARFFCLFSGVSCHSRTSFYSPSNAVFLPLQKCPGAQMFTTSSCDFSFNWTNSYYSLQLAKTRQLKSFTNQTNITSLDFLQCGKMVFLDLADNPTLTIATLILPPSLRVLLLHNILQLPPVLVFPPSLEVLSLPPTAPLPAQYPSTLLFYYCQGSSPGVCFIPSPTVAQPLPRLTAIVAKGDYYWNPSATQFPSLLTVSLLKSPPITGSTPRMVEEAIPTLNSPLLWSFQAVNSHMGSMGYLPFNITYVAVSSAPYLVTFPTEWENMPNLKVLQLCGSNGTTPITVSNTSTLVALFFCNHNQVTTSLTEQLSLIDMTTMPALRVLSLRNNSLSGVVPEKPSMPALWLLDVSWNWLSNMDDLSQLKTVGDVPDQVLALKVIPDSWNSFPSWSTFSLVNNYLVGNLPNHALTYNITWDDGNVTLHTANISYYLRLDGNPIWCRNNTMVATGFVSNFACVPPIYGLSNSDRAISYFNVRALVGANLIPLSLIGGPAIAPLYTLYSFQVVNTTTWKTLADIKSMSATETGGLQPWTTDIAGTLSCQISPAGCTINNLLITPPGDYWFTITARVTMQYAWNNLLVRLGPFKYSLTQTCSPGYGIPNAQASTCSICADGTFSAGTMGTQQGAVCRQCPGGTSSSSSTSTSFCNDCTPGSYAPPRSATCSLCAPGTISEAYRNITCNSCTVGKYSTAAGGTVCDLCDPGTYQDAPSSSSCLACGMTAYNPHVGASSCELCPANSAVMIPGAISVKACVCTAGSYNLTGVCTLCPNGAACDGGQEMPHALPGWWRSANPASLSNTSQPIAGIAPFTFLQCVPASACLGGIKCDSRYTGEACSSCVPLKSHRNNGLCEKCPPAAGGMWFLLMLLFVLLCLGLLRLGSPPHTRLNSLSIAISNAQLISIFATFRVSWPGPTRNLLNLFSIINFNIDVFSPECSTPMDYWTKWTAQLLLPLYFLGVFGIIYTLTQVSPKFKVGFNTIMHLPLLPLITKPLRSFGNAARRRVRESISQQRDRDRDLDGQIHLQLATLGSTREPPRKASEAVGLRPDQVLRWRFLYSTLILLTTSYTYLVHVASAPFNCIKVDDQTWILATAPDKQCYTAEWKKYSGVAFFFYVLYGAGVPLVIVTALWWGRWSYKRKLAREGEVADMGWSDAKVAAGYKVLSFRLRFGLLTDPYRNQYFFWEIARLARNLAIVVAVDLSSASSYNGKVFLQALVALFILVMFMALHEFAAPYEFPWDNRLTFTWNFVTLLTVFEALVVGSADLPPGIVDAYVLLLIFSITFALAFTVFVLYKEFQRRLQRDRIADEMGQPFEMVEKWERDVVTAAFPNHHEGVWRKLRTVEPPLRIQLSEQIANSVPTAPKLKRRAPPTAPAAYNPNPRPYPEKKQPEEEEAAAAGGGGGGGEQAVDATGVQQPQSPPSTQSPRSTDSSNSSVQEEGGGTSSVPIPSTPVLPSPTVPPSPAAAAAAVVDRKGESKRPQRLLPSSPDDS